MKAPSEKHLEDWIVANPEKVIIHVDEDYSYSLFERIIARQPRLPHGRPDLVVKRDCALSVVELKKGLIKSDTVTQCARYLKDLQSISYCRHVELTLYNYPDTPRINLPIVDVNNYGLSGVVIGSGIESDNLKIACEMLNIGVIQYSFDGAGYTFNSIPSPDKDKNRATRDWSQGAIGDAIYETMIEKLKLEAKAGWHKIESPKVS